tara:strand:+ start:62 stop:814 length:753 start_codon:yes stop_codon:yes gene_type:complete
MNKITLIYKKIAFLFKKKINIDNYTTKKETLDELFTYYGTDKASNVKNQYNKKSSEIIGHGYSNFYEKYLSEFKSKNFNLLEIGTWYGSSCAAFAKYFDHAQIYGIDRNFKFKFKSKRIKFLYCDLRSESNLNHLEREISNKKFKVIIDDGSHILTHILKNLIFFFKFVEKGGYFVVEDYNFPKIYKHLNDGGNDELFFDEVLEKLKTKNYFNSKILSKEQQKYLFDNIKEIYQHKGTKFDSDIVFLKKL